MNEFSASTEHVIAVYANHDQAGAAAENLSELGLDPKQFTIVGPNYQAEPEPPRYTPKKELLWAWGKVGAFWGAVVGLLVGFATIRLSAGAGFLFGALWGAFVGAALGVIGALARETHPVEPSKVDVTSGSHGSLPRMENFDVPEENAAAYEEALKAGSFLVIAHGTAQDLQRAMDVLNRTPVTRLDVYSNRFNRLGFGS